MKLSNLNKENYKRFRDFPLEMCILVFNIFCFCIYWHSLIPHFLKKSTESNVFCGTYIFLISHHFYSPPFQYLLTHPFSSSSTFKSEWSVTKTPFHRIAFMIYSCLPWGQVFFCVICLKTSQLSFGKTIVCSCDLVKLMTNQATR